MSVTWPVFQQPIGPYSSAPFHLVALNVGQLPSGVSFRQASTAVFSAPLLAGVKQAAAGGQGRSEGFRKMQEVQEEDEEGLP